MQKYLGGHGVVGAFTTGAKPTRKDSRESNETSIMFKNAVKDSDIQS